MKLAAILLSVAVITGAGFELRLPPESDRPEAVAFRMLNQAPPDIQKALRLYTEALQADSVNAYRWADLGSAFQASGDLAKARYCYSRAIQLSGQIPPIWLRDANFHLDLDEPQAALISAARVLKTVPDYDAVLFGYFDRFGLATRSILAQIGDDRRATRAYTQYLIDSGLTPAAKIAQTEEVWSYAFNRGFMDGPLTRSYLDALLRARRYSGAQRDWVRFLGPERGDYPDHNLLFNGGFEKDPTGSSLDWQIQPSAGFDTIRQNSTVHDGQWALEIRFHGTANVSYANVIQRAYVTPGRYVLEAWIRTKGITTNEGPRVEVFDPESPSRVNVSTDSFLGSQDWKLLSLTLTVPSGTSLLAVRVARHPSAKFDNKIEGAFWIDSVKLTKQ